VAAAKTAAPARIFAVVATGMETGCFMP
jgi:hypothetical protein